MQSTHVDAARLAVDHCKGAVHTSGLTKFMRSNQGTLIHQKPLVFPGDKVQAGDVLADGSSTDHGEIALGRVRCGIGLSAVKAVP